MKAEISLTGAVFIIVGFVIGASIYVLPGDLYELAGPFLIISFLVAAIPAAMSCLLAACIGSAFPSEAANIKVVRRALSPFLAGMTAWGFVGASIVGTSLLAYGFSDYLITLFPSIGAGRAAVAATLVVVFGMINFFGVRSSARIQTLLVSLLIIALSGFIAFGVKDFSADNFIPFSEKSPNGAILAIIPSFFAFLGFSMVVEISGDVRDPERNVPLSLAWAMAIIVMLYMAAIVVVVGVVPGDLLAESNSAIGTAAEIISPGLFAFIIKISALLAAATSVNALILLSSRDALAFFHMTKRADRIEPHESRRSEGLAVIGVSAASILCILSGLDIATYAIITVVGFLLSQIIICLAAMRLPDLAGTRYETLHFRLSPLMLRSICWALLICCVAFIGVSLLGSAGPAIATAIFFAAGAAFFKLIQKQDSSGNLHV